MPGKFSTLLDIFSSKYGGGDLKRHYEYPPKIAKNGGGVEGLTAPSIFVCKSFVVDDFYKLEYFKFEFKIGENGSGGLSISKF